jgi:hypothetical protein
MKPPPILRDKLRVLFGILVLFGLFSLLMIRLLSGAAATAQTAPDQPRREIEGDIESPTISFIDSPSATCRLPVPNTNACYIQWQYLYVTASPSQYIISMTVAIDNQIRAAHTGFFQTNMYIPADMVAPGYKVACGPPADETGLGNTYAYVIRARETGGLAAANYGSVTCPGDIDIIRIFLPFIQKP